MTAAVALQPLSPWTPEIAEPAWARPKRFRPPDQEQLAVFRPRVRTILTYAARNGLKIMWLTLTSDSRGGRARVDEDLRRCWSKVRHKAAWRRIPTFLAIYATHDRPHAHVLLAVPRGTTLRAICRAWAGGITHYSTVRGVEEAEGIAAYCAAQRGARIWNRSIRRRSFTFRAPPGPHLVCVPPPGPSPIPAGPAAAGAGGHPGFDGCADEDRSAARSRGPQATGGRPTAGGEATGREARAESNLVCPPCGSGRILRLVTNTGSPVMNSAVPDLPGVRAGMYSREEIQLGMLHLRAHVPRERGAAIGVGALVAVANLDVGLVEESLMRLFYAGLVKRRRDGRSFVYWAHKSLPPPVVPPVVIPGRLRHFREPPDFRTRPPPSFPPSP